MKDSGYDVGKRRGAPEVLEGGRGICGGGNRTL
jgi:hypothetical protein